MSYSKKAAPKESGRLFLIHSIVSLSSAGSFNSFQSFFHRRFYKKSPLLKFFKNA